MSELMSNPQSEPQPWSTAPSGPVSQGGPDGLDHPGIAVRYDAVTDLSDPSGDLDAGDAESAAAGPHSRFGAARRRIEALLGAVAHGVLSMARAGLRAAYRYPRWALVIVCSVLILGATALTRPGKPTPRAEITSNTATVPSSSPDGREATKKDGKDSKEQTILANAAPAAAPKPKEKSEDKPGGETAVSAPLPDRVAAPAPSARRSPMPDRRTRHTSRGRRPGPIRRRRARSPSRPPHFSPLRPAPRSWPLRRKARRLPPHRRRSLRRDPRRLPPPRRPTRHARIRKSFRPSQAPRPSRRRLLRRPTRSRLRPYPSVQRRSRSRRAGGGREDARRGRCRQRDLYPPARRATPGKEAAGSSGQPTIPPGSGPPPQPSTTAPGSPMPGTSPAIEAQRPAIGARDAGASTDGHSALRTDRAGAERTATETRSARRRLGDPNRGTSGAPGSPRRGHRTGTSGGQAGGQGRDESDRATPARTDGRAEGIRARPAGRRPPAARQAGESGPRPRGGAGR